MTNQWLCSVSLCSAILLLVGCDSASTPSAKSGSDDSAPAPLSTLTGDIKIDGSSTVLPISNAIKEQFEVEFPNVNVSVSGAGTGNGFERFQKEETDISGASRPIKPGEFAACQEAGVEFIELPVAYDGLTIVVHPSNDWVQQLTVEQIQKIFVGDEAAKTWKDVDPAWPAEPIQIFAPGTGSGTYDYFVEVVVGKSGNELRGDMSLNEDDNVLVQGVAGSKNAIGFFGVAYYEENRDKLRAVPIVNPEDDQAYLPTKENIAQNQYAPFSRPLFIYVNSESLNKAQVQTFVEYYMENASTTSEQVGYVRLPDDVIARGMANLDAVKTGTHFVDEQGNSRRGPISQIFVDSTLVQ